MESSENQEVFTSRKRGSVHGTAGHYWSEEEQEKFSVVDGLGVFPSLGEGGPVTDEENAWRFALAAIPVAVVFLLLILLGVYAVPAPAPASTSPTAPRTPDKQTTQEKLTVGVTEEEALLLLLSVLHEEPRLFFQSVIKNEVQEERKQSTNEGPG